MNHTLPIITPAQVTDALKAVALGFNLDIDVWNSLFDMGLVDSEYEEDDDRIMCDVLTEAGRKWLEGQGQS